MATTDIKGSGESAVRRATAELGKPKADGRLMMVLAFDTMLGAAFPGKDLRDTARADFEITRKELYGPNPSPLEKLLVDRILICQTDLMRVEQNYAWNKSGEVAVLEFWQKRWMRSQKMYLQAIESLAKVRRLQIPMLVQVNVDQRGGG